MTYHARAHDTTRTLDTLATTPDAVVDDPRATTSRLDLVALERLAAGDADALRGFYERYGSIVFGVAYRVLGDRQLAEECTQDAFLTLWREASRFDSGRARVSTWLYVVTRNRAIHLLRAREARPATPVAEITSAGVSPDPAELVQERDSSRVVFEALAELPHPQLEVIRLAFFEGRAHSEIADQLGLPLGTVKGRIRLALDRLRDRLGQGTLDAADLR